MPKTRTTLKKSAGKGAGSRLSASAGAMDFWMLFSVMILVVMGVTMVFSASAPYALSRFDDSYFFFRNQLKFALIGFVVMIVTSRIDYHIYKGKVALWGIIVSVILLVMVRVPGIGVEENGSWRWIGLGPLQFQPSEIAKIALIVFFADRLSARRIKPTLNLLDLLPYAGIMILFAGLFMIEPHLSCTVISMLVCLVLLLCAGARLAYFVVGLAGMTGIGVAAVSFFPYMKDRVDFFINPYLDASGKGYQIIQSMLAIGSGGLLGRGLGKSMQKFLYLPEPQNDFIFSVLAEELGFVGVVGVLSVFMIFFFRGMKVAMQAGELYGSLLAAGITSLIAIQTFLNMMVVTKLIPSTGVSLPFFSAGGTSLVILMAAVGILLNISRQAGAEKI